MLRPFSLLAVVWLVAAGFSVLGLIALGLRADRAGRRVTRRQLWAVILGASIALILILVEAILFQYPVPFWWIGTAAVVICWLGFGDAIAQIIGGRRKLMWAFLASLLGIGAIVEIWSLGHWFYSGFVPLAGYSKTWPDLEMNLTYAWSSLFPAIFLVTWLSPIWAFIAVKLYRMANRRKRLGSQISESPQVQQIKLGLDDFILLLVLILICVVIGFYPYFHDPSWLVGTDAYWRYKDPLERVAGSPSVLAAASSERHGLYLLILYGIMSVTGLSPFDIVKASPMILAALLSALTYLAVTRFRGSRTEGSLQGSFQPRLFPRRSGFSHRSTRTGLH